VSRAADAAAVARFQEQNRPAVMAALGRFLDAHPNYVGEIGVVLSWDDDAGRAIVDVNTLEGLASGMERAMPTAPDATVAAELIAALRTPMPATAPDTWRVRTMVSTPDDCHAVAVATMGTGPKPAGAHRFSAPTTRQQRRAAERAKATTPGARPWANALPSDPKGSPDVVQDPDGSYRLNAYGLAKVMLVTARNPPKGEERAQAHTRAKLALFCGVPAYDRVEQLAASLGDAYVIEAAVAYMQVHGLESIGRPQ
jgi:hypothetical protein